MIINRDTVKATALLGDQAVGVAGDDILLVGGDNDSGDLGVGSADDDIFAHHLVVEFEVDLDAKALEAFEDGTTHEPGVLADAAGEEEQVAAAHLGHVAADVAFHTLGEHVEGVGGTLVAGIAAGADVAHVLLVAADADEAALLVEDLGDVFQLSQENL